MDLKKKKKRFRVGYGYPWIINPGKIQVWILMGNDIRVSMGKLFRSGMGIPNPYSTHDHPYKKLFSILMKFYLLNKKLEEKLDIIS